VTPTPADLLDTARLYLCTDARRQRGDFAEFVDTVYAAGVDIVQLREKGLEAAEEIALLEIVAAAAQRHGKLFAVNDRADVAAAVSAPVLHLGQDDLPVTVARRLLGDEVIIGRSTHSPEQFDAALLEPGIDYLCAGPLWATPTKPGRPAAGLSLLSYASSAPRNRPWFAIGGIDGQRLAQVVSGGASRVVVVRAITEAEDPGAAVRALLSGLPAPV
jgi:thiamine-phosphate pyrophosphorylase